MGQIGNMLADAAGVGLKYAHRLSKDIHSELFGRFANVHGQMIVSNHPAFVIGHLSLYPAKTLSFLGREHGAATVPTHYEQVLSRDAKCTDDPDGTIYPPKDELLAFFDASYDTAIQSLRAASDESLIVKNPVDSPMALVCTSLGSMLGFYMSGHVTMHLGQMSAWRRMQGLPPA